MSCLTQRPRDTKAELGQDPACLRGFVPSCESSSLGAGTFKFWWRVSSQQAHDYLEFYRDGQLQDAISGTVAWTEKTYTITGSGTHTLKWRYVKDASGTGGSEDRGWVDYVQWSGTMTEPAADAWATINYVYDAAGRRIGEERGHVFIIHYSFYD